MNFRDMNKFNVVTNIMSSNLLPLTENDYLGLLSKMWLWLSWILQIIFYLTAIIGATTVPVMRILEKDAITTTTGMETIISSLYLSSQRKKLCALIRLFNEILVDNDLLKKLLKETIDPQKKSLKIYLITTTFATGAFGLAPLFLIYRISEFGYDHFIEPAYLPGAPFSANVFIAGVVFQCLTLCLIRMKKVGVDVYISYFVMILTAEYKYIRMQIAKVLHFDSDNDENYHRDEKDVVIALGECIKHHCNVIKAGQMLIDTVAVPVAVAYLSSILRFCFLGFAFITFADTYFLKTAYLLFTAGALLQVYLYCSCVQDLVDASVSITDDAFYEDWYGRGKDITKILSTMELSNRIECRLSAWRIVDMTTPTFTAIISKAYSTCLLLLKFR